MTHFATSTRFIIAAALIIVALSCGQPGRETVVLDFWAMGAEGETVIHLVPEFERTHPHIRVRVQPIPWTAAHEKLLTAYAGDATPDLCQLGNTWIPEFAALHALEPLNDRIARSAEIDSSHFFSGAWASSVIDGSVLALPWYVDTRLLFYRTDILREAGFDSPPRTWEEWTRQLDAVKRVAGENKFAILLPINEFEAPVTLALQQDDLMVRDHGTRGNFRSPGFREAFSFYVSLFESGWAPRMANTEISNVWQEFGQGFFSFFITGPWNISTFRERLPSGVADHWTTAPMPAPGDDPSAYPGAGIAGGAGLAIFRSSEKKEEAWQFIEYLLRPENQIALHQRLGNLPARLVAWEDPVLAENPYAAAFYTQLTRVRPTPQIPEWERIASMIWQQAEAVVNGRRTIDAALEQLDRDVDRLLEKRRWMLSRETRPPREGE